MLKHLRLLALGSLVTGLAMSGSSVLGQSVPVADEFKDLHFRSIGPASMSGRVTDLAVYEANPAIYYVATAHGGVWKTASGGALYEAQLQGDGQAAPVHMSFGAVAISQKDPNLAWAGGGESNNRQSTSWGDGIYKTTNGGRTWTNMGLRNSKHIARIVIDPLDNNIVFVAATGGLWGPGGDRGVYKTTDGGVTWKNVLKGPNDFTGATDLVMSHTDRNVMYAAMYQRQRSQCCFNGGGPGSGMFKSTDNGETWTKLTVVPAGNMGRIAVDVFRRSSNLLYALVEAEAASGLANADQGPASPPAGGGRAAGAGGGRGGDPAQAGGGRGGGGRGGQGGGASQNGLYRSDDGGATWRRVSTNNPRPMYFSQVRIDPNNPDRVYLGGVGVHMTNDGGATMGTDVAQSIHDDIHAIWINPANSNHVLIGGDGGVAVTQDMARTWSQHHNLPLGLFYHISVDNDTPYNVCGGLQDNYNWCGPSQVRFAPGIKNTDWYQVQGGDGFVVLQDPRDSRYVFSESQDGNIQRRNRITGEARNIRPNFVNVTNLAPGTTPPQFRWNWDTPMVFSHHEPGAILVAAQRVFRSNDRGDSWTVISQDLTTNTDRNEMQIMGQMGSVAMLSKNDGISFWATVVSLGESPKQAGLYFTGSDDGVVSMSRDGGAKWENVTSRLPGFPKWGYVSEVVPSKFDANTVYVTVDAHREGDFRTYMWASSDMGTTWRSINGNLRDEVVRTMIEDTKNPDVLYIGTETGIFVTTDRAKSWKRLKGRNFPTVRVDEMVIHPRDNALVVGTHGRSVWILDHLEPIQEYAAAQAATTDARLFTPGPAVQFRMWDNQNDEFWGHRYFLGENPPADAVIQFHLKKAVMDPRIRITDATGREVRELVIPSNRNAAGIQTICWDMRVAPLSGGGAAPGGFPGGGGQGRGGAPGGGQGGPTGLAGVPVPQPRPGADAFNPCGGAVGGGGFGGGVNAGPLVYPGTYNVALTVAGKVVETKSMRVSADPSVQMSAVEAKRYYDIAMDLHDMQRRSSEMATALGQLNTAMGEIEGKSSAWPAAVKTQFDATKKELDAIRAKFTAAPPPPPAGGGGRGGGGLAAPPTDFPSRVGLVKGTMMAFQDNPSPFVMGQYTELKASVPKAILDGNTVLTKAMSLSAALKKNDVTLTVPSPVK